MVTKSVWCRLCMISRPHSTVCCLHRHRFRQHLSPFVTVVETGFSAQQTSTVIDSPHPIPTLGGVVSGSGALWRRRRSFLERRGTSRRSLSSADRMAFFYFKKIQWFLEDTWARYVDRVTYRLHLVFRCTQKAMCKAWKLFKNYSTPHLNEIFAI